VDEPPDDRSEQSRPGLAVGMGCISLFGFVVIAFFVGVVTVFGAYHLALVDAIVLGSLALSGVGLLFVRSWAARGIGIGLLLGWALLTIVSAGTCTGINSGLYGGHV
jgi:hypothetical protein